MTDKIEIEQYYVIEKLQKVCCGLKTKLVWNTIAWPDSQQSGTREIQALKRCNPNKKFRLMLVTECKI